MAGCCDNFTLIDGGDEFKAFPGLKGEDGTTYYPHVSSEGVLSWTNDGGKTNPDPVDISGPPGRSVEMRGPVASVSDLPTTAPSDELWLVGSTSPYDGWFYNGTSWQNIGQISVGPPGPQGEQGEDGFSPTISTNEVSGGCFITITDATGTETVFLSDGASAGFGTPTATVDANVGTPSVEVTATGPNTAKVFNFAFHNLKGESGGGGGGTSNYNDLSNKPSIQGVTLSGNKTASDLGLALATEVLPAGGSTMDFLAKSSNTDYDAQWVSLYSSSTPAMDGTGSAGITSTFSRSDHVHPTDTSRQATITANGLLKGDGSGGVSAAVDGTDYLTPATNYSPIMVVQQDASLTSNILGKTISVGQSGYGTVTVTIPKSTFDALPDGAEVAFMREVPSGSECIIKVVGVPIANEGSGWVPASNSGIEVKIPARYGMIAFKKIYNLAFLVTGNVEVVT